MVRTDEITNMQDVIDSRDVIARIEELESDFEDWKTDAEESAEAEGRTLAATLTVKDWAELSEDGEELLRLQSLASEAEGYAADWQHGECLIRDSYFTDYIWDMLEDCGEIPKEMPHYIVVDREATAENCKVDYTSVDFDGVTYWIR